MQRKFGSLPLEISGSSSSFEQSTHLRRSCNRKLLNLIAMESSGFLRWLSEMEVRWSSAGLRRSSDGIAGVARARVHEQQMGSVFAFLGS
ncbi:hypothetical protein M0R45_034734 [Rubus argutus]|uniref:Uncharacterized protein n=1 Tax=Rubus argutus TaxID=59490 RepID=A0AAW1VSQ4_RUBAR